MYEACFMFWCWKFYENCGWSFKCYAVSIGNKVPSCTFIIFRVELSKKSDPECKGIAIFQNLGNFLLIDALQHPNILESHLAPLWETQI